MLDKELFDKLVVIDPSGEIIRAIAYGDEAHGTIGQKRKYSGADYIVHPIEVLRILIEHGVTDVASLRAAPVHDVIEDVWPKVPRFSLLEIGFEFGRETAEVVKELTDVYTSEAYPHLNRAARKKLEAERISKISDSALKVKLADFISNTSDIFYHDEKFARAVYLPEKARVLDLVRDRVLASEDESLRKLFETASSQIR